jgi:hypothetical protein
VGIGPLRGASLPSSCSIEWRTAKVAASYRRGAGPACPVPGASRVRAAAQAMETARAQAAATLQAEMQARLPLPAVSSSVKEAALCCGGAAPATYSGPAPVCASAECVRPPPGRWKLTAAEYSHVAWPRACRSVPWNRYGVSRVACCNTVVRCVARRRARCMMH